MIDPELKKKIVNTISKYEEKFEQLQGDIHILRSAMTDLCNIPRGIHVELDERLDDFCTAISSEASPNELKQQIIIMTEVISRLKTHQHQQQNMLKILIVEGGALIKPYLERPKDQKQLLKLEKSTDSEQDYKLIIHEFNLLIKQSLENALAKQQQQHTEKLDARINDSFMQLLDHLAIPVELNEKLHALKEQLEHELNPDSIRRIIDDLTDLVIEAFNFEQNKFKQFLQQLTGQLRDFNDYLHSSSRHLKQSSLETLRLEEGITSHIEDIHAKMGGATSLDDLRTQIMVSLVDIGDTIKNYREQESNRHQAYQEEITQLKDKLNQSEHQADEIRQLLSYQKYRINHDSLTGLPNRDSFDEHLLDAVHRWQRGYGDLALAVGDIDKFKFINDTYGHLAGDKVLKKVANILKGSIRAVDFVARFGGEEFVMIFERTAKEDVLNILEQIRQGIEECEFIYREKRVDVTISFGMTMMGQDDDIESLFHRADKAMYQAKHAGRNCLASL